MDWIWQNRILDEKSTFEYLYENRNASNIGEIINKALEALRVGSIIMLMLIL